MDISGAIRTLTTVAGVLQDRAEEYDRGGDVENHFQKVADYWSTYLGVKIKPEHVPDMLSLLKMARRGTGQPNPDNFLDDIGYPAISALLSGVAPDEKD